MKTSDYHTEKATQWCLEAVADANREWLVTIDAVHFIIGRADDCNLKLIDKRISRHHAEIRISGDLLWIRDLGSTNGTFVGGARIERADIDAAPIADQAPGQAVVIGGYQLLFQVGELSTAPEEEIEGCRSLVSQR